VLGTGLAESTTVSFIVSMFIFIVFLNRYVFGLYLRLARGKKMDAKNESYEPTVTVVIPLFNEGQTIYNTIASLAKVEYPRDKLSVTVIDDCSTDDSYEWACKAASEYPNVRVIRNPHNMGKRRGINRAVRAAEGSEIIVSVDSDVIVYPTAIRELVQRFVSPDIAAVGGRVHVSNPNENWLTKMQTIKYFYGQEFLKNLERGLDSVMCLSGCLTMDAMCFTKAPAKLRNYFSQQLRWKRSNIVDYLIGLTHAWRLHPIVCIHYLSLLLLLFVYPFVIVEHMLNHQFFQLATFHFEVIALFGVIYYFAPSTRKLPPWLRVHPISFLPMTVLMPVAYLMLTPLGLMTLDTSSWETRGHGAIPKGVPG
jgi:cellulose synthase/poly-beta-1,6-N-acetylglucosamine synthase-like glycosyltransferase